jgi:hypothetical protein
MQLRLQLWRWTVWGCRFRAGQAACRADRAKAKSYPMAAVMVYESSSASRFCGLFDTDEKPTYEE